MTNSPSAEKKDLIEEEFTALRVIRGHLVSVLDKALSLGIITQKERDVLYFRHIDWNSLESCGKHFGVTRERIRQIEAKALEKMRVNVPSL